MPRRPTYARPLSITVQTRTGHTVSVVVSYPDGAKGAPVLKLAGGMWSFELAEPEARRVAQFAAEWWLEG